MSLNNDHQNRLVKTVVQNTFWLALAEIISRGLKFLLFIYAARILGSYFYGVFSFAFSLAAILAIISDLGVFTTSVREFSKDKSLMKKSFGDILGLEFILSLIYFLILVGLSFLNYHDPSIKYVLVILGGYMALESLYQFFFAAFRAEQKMRYESITRILNVVITVICGFLLLTYKPSAINFSYAYITGSIVAIVYASYLYLKHFGSFKIHFNLSIYRKFLSLAWPLASVYIFYNLYHSLDSVVLGFYHLINQTGLYNAAYKIMDMAILPVILISASFFPHLSSYQKDDDFAQNGRQTFKLNWFWSIAIGLPIIATCILLAPQIIQLLYGPSYLSAAPVLQILMLTALVIYLSYPLFNLLIARGQQKLVFYISASGAVLNLVLNLILIPYWGFYVAAISTLIT